MVPCARTRAANRLRGPRCRVDADITCKTRLVTPGQLDGSSARREPLLDPGWGPTIQDLVGLQPSSSRHRHAVLHERKTRRVMGVAVYGNQAASLAGALS